MPQVIQWEDPQPDDIIWTYPSQNIQWGAQLVVHEMEEAIFFRDGKAYDTFGPGRHTITTLNLPLLTSELSRIAGYGETPFKATVIFVSTREFNGKYGARAQTTELAPLLVHGGYWFKIKDPELFVNEVTGRRDAYTTSSVNEFLKGFLNEQIIDELSKYSLTDVFTKLDETSMAVKTRLLDAFERLGIELIDLKFEGIDTTPDYRERLFWLKSGGVPVAADEVLRMETVRRAAKELGESQAGGAAIGAGMMLIPPMFQTGTAPQAVLLLCPECQARVPATSKFCPNCGNTLAKQPASTETKTCPNCKQVVPPTAKFCQNCGEKTS
jgi:membrane protease subunit (stomatin/prohibitin family)